MRTNQRQLILRHSRSRHTKSVTLLLQALNVNLCGVKQIHQRPDSLKFLGTTKWFDHKCFGLLKCISMMDKTCSMFGSLFGAEQEKHPLFEGGSFEMLAQGAHDSGVMLILFWCIAFLRVTLIYVWLNCIENGCFPSLSCLETRTCRSLRFILCWCGSATFKAIPVVNSIAESSKQLLGGI